MKLNLKFFKRHKTVDEYKEVIEDLQYDEFSTKDKFSSFEQVANNSLLENNLSKKNPLFIELFQKIEDGIDDKHDFVLRDFVVTWIQNKRFSKSLLVPAVASKENPNIEAVNLSSSTDKDIALFLNTFNIIAKKLIEQEEKVEILPNIIVYKSRETNVLKIAFSPQIIK